MSAELRQRANSRLDDALRKVAVQDPRDSYRDRLRLLREQDQAAFDEARRYYEDVLVPRVAEPESDPLHEWFEYGILLARLGGGSAGKTVAIDRTGRALELEVDRSWESLFLYLPDDARAPALALAMPTQLSPAQQASYDLLILGSRK